MKKTYIFMMLSGLSLAGAPLITSGFWSKDAIFASLLESGYTFSWQLFGIAVVVAIMTAFYTFRMIGMAFFGKESRHLEEMQHEGHHLHEVGRTMWIPFGALAVATISIGLIGFAFEEQIHQLLGEYLADSFGIAEEGHSSSESEARIEDQESASFLGLNSTALLGSVGAFAVGSALGYLFFIARKANPEVISRNIFTRSIWKFLYNRWYLNSALYWGSVIVPLAIYRIIWRYFENVVVDGMNPTFQFSMTYFSRVVKAAQTGITQTYLFIFAAGVVIVTMLLFL